MPTKPSTPDRTLAVQTSALTAPTFTPLPITELKEMAAEIAASHMFQGIDTPAQAFSLMLLCQAEGVHPVFAFRRYHMVEKRPTMRADYMQGEYEARGNLILWHVRNGDECSGTFIRGGRFLSAGDRDAAVKRAKVRYKLQSKPDLSEKEKDTLSDLSEPDELTIIRTMAEAVKSRLATTYRKKEDCYGGQEPGWVKKKNWEQSGRQMLHARCLTEGVRATDPGLIAGVMVSEEAQDLIDDGTEPETIATYSQEELMRQAVANSTGEAQPKITAPADDDELPGLGAKKVISEDKSDEITLANCGDLECHTGQIGGQLYREDGTHKTVGEIHEYLLKWIVETWPAKKSFADTRQDRRLVLAAKMELKKRAKPQKVNTALETPPEASTPAPEPKKGRKPAKNAKPATIDVPATVSKEPAKLDWRSVVNTLGGGTAARTLVGHTLGELADSKPNEYMPNADAVAILQALHNSPKGIATIDAKGTESTNEERELAAAVRAACKETGALLDEGQLRAEILARLAKLHIPIEDANAKLQKSGVLGDFDTIQKTSEELLRYIFSQWVTIKAVLTEKE